MSRLSLSDIVAAQEAMIERQAKQLERLTQMHAETLHALTERRSTPTASESVTIKRAGIGDKPTTIDVSAVVQEGETLEDARRRASIEYEAACERYPLPNGQAYAAELGRDDLEEKLRASVEGLRAVPAPEATK